MQNFFGMSSPESPIKLPDILKNYNLCQLTDKKNAIDRSYEFMSHVVTTVLHRSMEDRCSKSVPRPGHLLLLEKPHLRKLRCKRLKVEKQIQIGVRR